MKIIIGRRGEAAGRAVSRTAPWTMNGVSPTLRCLYTTHPLTSSSPRWEPLHTKTAGYCFSQKYPSAKYSKEQGRQLAYTYRGNKACVSRRVLFYEIQLVQRVYQTGSPPKLTYPVACSHNEGSNKGSPPKKMDRNAAPGSCQPVPPHPHGAVCAASAHPPACSLVSFVFIISPRLSVHPNFWVKVKYR